MAPIRVNLPDKQTRAMMTKAAGGEIVAPTVSEDVPMTQQFPVGTVANTPITKMAQFAGSGANVIFTQPMFFSPLHTPQNWQIASKRRESYQWKILAGTGLTLNDYTTKRVEDLLFDYDKVVKDPVTNGMWYQDIKSEPVLGASGKLRRPPHFSERSCTDKRCFGFSAYGYWRTLEVSEEHKIFVIDGKLYRHKRKLEKDAAYRRKIGIPAGGDKPPIEFPDKLIYKREAQDIVKDDLLIAPMPKLGKIALDTNKAWMVGLCIADGCLTKPEHSCRVDFTMDRNEYHVPELEKWSQHSFDGKTRSFQHGDGNGWRVSQSGTDIWEFFDTYITGKLTKKKFRADVFELDKESRLHVLGGYFDGDGHFSPPKGLLVANNYSCDMADQLYWMLLSVGINCSLKRLPLYGEHYETDSEWCYRIIIPSSEVPKLQPYLRSSKIPQGFKPKPQRQLRFFYEEDGVTYLAQPIQKIREFKYTGKGYDLQIDPERAFVASGYVASNCRFWYDNEPKVAAGVDFYANFPLSGFKLESRSKKICKYFEQAVEDLDLEDWLAHISHEYYLLGDVFPFLEIECEHCGGSGTDREGEQCNHKGGSFSRVVLMNPDYVEVQTNVLAKEPVLALMPDEELRMLVQRREPKQIYDRLDPKLIDLVASGRPIPLSNRSVSHIKHNASSYATYSSPLLRRMFTILAYKTKIMTANWITAERLILPVRIVKVGDKDRPASDDDISNVQSQLSAVVNDPNMTIVTHHAFEYSWEGATSKIHNITSEMENIGKEVLDGFMLNQALLNGEAAGYTSAQVGVEILIKRLERWQSKLAKWVEKHIFLPIAMMQGFIDEEESKIVGKPKYIYPTIKWNDLKLRDKSSNLQLLMQVYDKELVSGQTICEEFELDYDIEQERLREERLVAMQSGQIMPGAGGAEGAMGGGGMPMGGGLGGPPGAEGAMGIEGAPLGMPGAEMGGMGAPPGGGMGAPPGGGMGAPPGGGMPAAASADAGLAIPKRGKAREQAGQEPVPTRVMRLTKIEQKMYKVLSGLNVPFALFGQYAIKLPGQQQPFSLDFAYPEIGIGIETDGKMWHEREDLKERDMQRDQKLANVGWRILRFKEEAVEEHIDTIKDVILQNITEAAKDLKKAAENDTTFEKFASLKLPGTRFAANGDEETITVSVSELDNGLGKRILIGEPETNGQLQPERTQTSKELPSPA